MTGASSGAIARRTWHHWVYEIEIDLIYTESEIEPLVLGI